MYNFNTRLRQLLTFDKIRMLKLLEILQYSVIILILSIIFSIIYRYLFPFFDFTSDNFVLLVSSLIIQTFIIIVCLFYIRKIALLFPSIAYNIYSKFISHTTFEFYTLHICAFVVFVELLPMYTNNLHQISELLN